MKITDRNKYLILRYRCKTPEEVRRTVEQLGNCLMKESSHSFEKYGAIKIVEAAKKQSECFLNSANDKNNNAAIMLMSVVLAANRNYNRQVQPHVERMQREFPGLTLDAINALISKHDYKGFRDVWGHADEKKYNTLKSMVNAILDFRGSSMDDMSVLRKWAANARLEARKEDPLGCLRNIGVATFQHLRITFGVDTVKPDQRVMEVLGKEFGARLSSDRAIRAVEEIAEITQYKVNEIDQIFVKYGSGYYHPG